MPVYKVNKDENFTVVSNVHLRDKRLSLKAKGLMTMVLSLSPEWDYSISGLASICKEGTSAVKSALDELKACGYLTVTKIPPTAGNAKFDYLYEFYEKPLDIDSLGVEDLCLEDLGVENRQQLNTDELKSDRESKEGGDEKQAQERLVFIPKGCSTCGGNVLFPKERGERYECEDCHKMYGVYE